MTDHSEGIWDLIVTPWHIDEDIPDFPVPANATVALRPPLPDGPVPGRMSVLHQAVADTVAETARPLLLSGDCPTARGAVAGLQRRYSDLAVLWFDAHGDFNTPTITTSGYIGGMAIAMLTGRTRELFDDQLGLRPLPDAGIVLADARDLDPAEAESLAASSVHRVPAEPSAIRSALDRLGNTPVYLHLDVDILDSTQVSGLRFPSGPGPSVQQIAQCLATARETAHVVGAGMACAWLPDHVGDQSTLDTITLFINALGAEVTWRTPTG